MTLPLDLRVAARIGRIVAGIAMALQIATPTVAAGPLRLATTTSTENSGLLGVLLPIFEREHGIDVHVIAVGSGKAIKLGENGDVDVILSHAPALEEKFVAEGWGVDRQSVMYNDFVLVGPPDDPAGLRGATNTAEAFEKLAAARTDFISRGDLSGTHLKEQALWRAAGVEPSGSWYVSAGLGMGRVLLMASERQGYTLTDRGTFLSYKAKADLTIVFQGDPPLHNPYTIMAVNPARHDHANHKAATALIEWITGPEAQERIGTYKVGGEVLFFPDAHSGEAREATK